MNSENIKISEKTINGELRALKVYCPTHEEWVEAIGPERLAARFNQGLIAHDLATGLKAAYEEAKKPSVVMERAEMRRRIEDENTVFDLREFIASERKAAEDKIAAAVAAKEEAMIQDLADMLGCTVEEARARLEAKRAGK